MGVIDPPLSPLKHQVGILNSFVSNVYAKQGEESAPGPGEVDRARVWSNGANPGYRGKCYLGAPDWYLTGHLPADALTGPIPPTPYCCGGQVPAVAGGLLLGGSASMPGLWPPVGSGALLLGGSASMPGLWPPVGSGGLLLGGSAALPGLWPPVGSGGLLLGGSASMPGLWPPVGSGGLLLGGSAALPGLWPPVGAGGMVLGGFANASFFPGSGSGSGSDGGDFGPPVESCSECPDGAAREYAITLPALSNGTCAQCASTAGTWLVTYRAGCFWNSDNPFPCIGAGLVTLTMFSTFLTVDFGVAQYRGDRPAGGCLQPMTLGKLGDNGACVGWPGTITVLPH